MTQEPEKLTALTDFDDGPEAMLRRPELAAMIAAVASRATWIEDAFARLFVYLLNREEEAALSIYLNFFDNGVRLRVFNAVADTRLSEDDRKKFKKLHEQLATKLKPRNNLVHAW